MYTLYNNYHDDQMAKDARDYLLDEYGDAEGWRTLDDVPEERVWKELSREDEFNWDAFVAEMDRVLDKSDTSFLITGTVGRWNGRASGGFVFDTLKELSKCWRDCDYIKVEDDDGHLFITCSHHDGTNHFEIKRLTKRGEKFIEDNWDMDTEKLHSTAFNSNFMSGLPYLAKKLYEEE